MILMPFFFLATPLVAAGGQLSAADGCQIPVDSSLTPGSKLVVEASLELGDSVVAAVTSCEVVSKTGRQVSLTADILRFKGDLAFEDGGAASVSWDGTTFDAQGSTDGIQAAVTGRRTVTQESMAATVDSGVAERMRALLENLFSIPGTLPLADRLVNAGDTFDEGGYSWRVIEASPAGATLSGEANGEDLSVELRVEPSSGVLKALELTRIVRHEGSADLTLRATVRPIE